MSDPESEEEGGKSLSLTSFLFGNIDSQGQLEDDSTFDETARKQLSSLGALLGESDLKEIVKGENGDDSGMNGQGSSKDDENFNEKAPDAEDYSDMSELIDDEDESSDEEQGPNNVASNNRSETSSEPTGNNAATPSTVPSSTSSSDASADKLSTITASASSSGSSSSSSMISMPCLTSPSAGPSTTSTSGSMPVIGATTSTSGSMPVIGATTAPAEDVKSEAGSASKDSNEEKPAHKDDKPNDSILMPPPPPQSVRQMSEMSSKYGPTGFGSTNNNQQSLSNGLNTYTPLAGMLPNKYKDIHIKEVFPDFRENSVLRFSKLFPVKESHTPRPWRALKKRRKKERSDPEQTAKEEADLEAKRPRRGWVLNIAREPGDTDSYEECDSVKFHQPMEVDQSKPMTEQETAEHEKKGPKSTDWRWGPAQYWYDMLDLPEEVQEYDYGLKTDIDEKKTQIKADPEKKPETPDQKPPLPHQVPGVSDSDKENQPNAEQEQKSNMEYPPDAFLMVTQATWEEDVIWNGEEIKNKVLSKLNTKSNAAGWVPSSMSRTAGSFSQRPGVKPELQIRLATLGKKLPQNDDDTWYSIFPVENEDLVYGKWEDEVVWDPEQMPKKLNPRIVSLDPNDENIIIAIPDDIDPNTLPNEEPTRKIKIIQKHVKKSKLLLNRAGIISVVEEESPPPPPKNDDRDQFYIGNDEFYLPKEPPSIKVATGGTLLQHSTPSVQLQAPFIPTHMGPIKLRQFHRFPLKRYSHGPLSHYTAFHGVQSLYKHQRKMEKWRAAEREEAGGGDIFLMREPKDLSGKDGDIILMEYVEEYPPLMSFMGMCSKIKNYYKRKPENDKGPKEFKYGELTIAHTSPFLGTMHPGQTIQAIENNMYRAPMYPHKVPKTDFLIIRTRNEFSIREVNAFFVCGQECPLYEVPGPNSKRANNFTRDFLEVFIHRLFWKSKDNPRRIKMDDIKKAFPSHSESSIRKRLKPCAEFHRTGPDSNWWVMKPGFRLPTEEEIRAKVDPEQCCSFYSMIAAEQRLKDAGYGDKFILAQDDDDNNADQMDDEVKCAPWNTTRAYVQAMKGKCLLQLTGPADPTGSAKEGFSYVKIPNKPTNKEEQEAQPKRTVTGTDADLRKLPLKDAKAILRKNGVPEEEIKKLSRWEVIDVVRTLSTEKVKAGEEGADSFKFSRGNRFSIAEHQERYREDCQRIFEVQNKVLASDEVLSSDEAETSSEEEEEMDEEDLDQMAKNIENMLANKKTSNQVQREREEMERRKLKKVMMEDKLSEDMKAKKKKEEDEDGDSPGASKVLRITRTFKDSQGIEYTRTELVRKSLVIETYVKVRTTKDDQFIRQFATMDEQVKEEMKKEKRRLQEQLRRIKRNQEKERLGLNKPTPVRKRDKFKTDLKLKCGACGQVGHMRTNKACPKMSEDTSSNYPIQSNLNEEADRELMERERLLASDDLVTAEGTKIKFNEKILKHAEEMKKKSMQPKTPKEVTKSNKRKRAGTGKHCDYLDKKEYGPVKRRRTDPVISFCSMLENILNELRNMPESRVFLYPVPVKNVTDYYDVIKRPMDLQTIRENVQQKRYHNREEFLADIKQIWENSSLYNGETSIITIHAKVIMDRVIGRFSENDEYLMRLEKMINPLLDDDDLTALTYIFSEILEKNVKTMQESWPFMKPVNKKAVKDYYDIIKQPMDLETITMKIKHRKYHNSAQFLGDVELIYKNSFTFNGELNEYTMKAKRILDVVLYELTNISGHVQQIESRIRETQQRHFDQAEMDSLGASLGADHEEDRKPRRNKDGGLEDDLEYSSDDEAGDWDDVDSQQGPSTSDTMNQHNMQQMTGIPGNIVIKNEAGVINDQNIMVKDEPVDVNDYYSNQLQNTPVFDIRTNPDGGFYAEQAHGGYPAEQPGSGMAPQNPAFQLPPEFAALQHPQSFASHQDEHQVDENYDPTDFLQGLGGGLGVGVGVGGGVPPVALPDDVVVPSLVPQNGAENLVEDDLAVSDDSEDEATGQGQDDLNSSQDDAMAF